MFPISTASQQGRKRLYDFNPLFFLDLFQIDKQQFEETVRTLNNLYAEAEKLGSQSYIEGCLACLTAYTIFLCMETHYEKVMEITRFYISHRFMQR